MIKTTMNGTTMTLVAHGDIHEEQWKHIIYENNLQDSLFDHVDYRSELDDHGCQVHYWTFEITPPPPAP